MATYWITQVDHPSNKPITKVCAFETSLRADGKWSLGTTKSYTRQQIADALKNQTAQIYTCNWIPVKKVWRRGAEVVLTKDGKYITTVPTDTTRDNLGSLPVCTC